MSVRRLISAILLTAFSNAQADTLSEGGSAAAPGNWLEPYYAYIDHEESIQNEAEDDLDDFDDLNDTSYTTYSNTGPLVAGYDYDAVQNIETYDTDYLDQFVESARQIDNHSATRKNAKHNKQENLQLAAGNHKRATDIETSYRSPEHPSHKTLGCDYVARWFGVVKQYGLKVSGETAKVFDPAVEACTSWPTRNYH